MNLQKSKIYLLLTSSHTPFFVTLEQKLAHGGHPVLRWMMNNIYIRTDPAGNIKADKEKSTSIYLNL